MERRCCRKATVTRELAKARNGALCLSCQGPDSGTRRRGSPSRTGSDPDGLARVPGIRPRAIIGPDSIGRSCEASGSRRTSLATRPRLGRAKRVALWFARFGVVTLSHHPAPAPTCARPDAGRASTSRGPPRWPRRQAHSRCGSRSGCRVFPLRPSASARPAAPIPRGAFRSTPLDVSPASRLRSTRRARACAP